MFWKKDEVWKLRKVENLSQTESKFRVPVEPDIVIVGGGVAGLACADELLKYSFKNILILEANDRIGGRIHTVPFGSNTVDLGAQWCYGQKNNAVFQKVQEMRILKPETHIYENSQHIRSNGDIISNKLANQLTKVIVNILSSNSIIDAQCSLREFVEPLYFAELERLEHMHICPNVAKEFLDNFLKATNSDNGADDVSACGSRVYKHCGGEYMLNWRGQGFVKFLEYWLGVQDPTQNLGEMADFIRLRHTVEKIVWNKLDTLVYVTCSNGEQFKAHHVVVTLPLGVLKECKGSMFDPPLPTPKMQAIDGLGFNKICKIFLQFCERFWPSCWTGFSTLWRKDDLAELQRNPQMLWVQNIFGFYRVDYQPNVLLAWLVGDSTLKVEKMTSRDIMKGCQFVLKKFLKRMHITNVCDVCWSKWCSSPHFGGAYSYRAVRTEQLKTAATALEQPLVVLAEIHENSDDDDDLEEEVPAAGTSRKSLKAVVAGKSKLQPLTCKPLVLFAGEATSETYFSTVHGAIQSGQREANRLAGYYLRTDKI